MRPLARRSEWFGSTPIATMDSRSLALDDDKESTLELARRVGVPVPESHFVESAEQAREIGASLGWPVVLKRFSHRMAILGRHDQARGDLRRDREQLARRMKRFEGQTSVLLQRYLPGSGHGVSMLMYEGQEIAAFEHRRLHEVPLSGGASVLRESVPLDAERHRHARRLLGELNWTGLAMVEFKVGDGRCELMEINGRIWGSMPLAIAAGRGLPHLARRRSTCAVPTLRAPPTRELSIRPAGTPTRGDLLWLFRCWLSAASTRLYDIAALRRDPRSAQSVRSARGAGCAVTSDPLPGCVELPRDCRQAGAKVTRGIAVSSLRFIMRDLLRVTVDGSILPRRRISCPGPADDLTRQTRNPI